MSDSTILEDIKKNDRYFVALLAGFILGLLLLFYKDLSPWIQSHFVPAYVIYVTGATLIAQIQNMVGNRIRLACDAAMPKKPFTGTPIWFFVFIVSIHIAWFCILIWFLLPHLPSLVIKM